MEARGEAAVGRLEEFRKLMVAEELFEFLGVPCDPRVLRVYRLHVLRRFGLEMELIDREHPALREEARLALYGEALARAHDLFRRRAPGAERIFGALGAPPTLVQLPRRKP